MSRDKAEIIAYAIRKECQKCYWYETYGITFDEFEEFLSNGIKGIEKQIPKKPIEIDTYGEYYKCPICNKYIVDNFGCADKFCRECGQAIDWSDEE